MPTLECKQCGFVNEGERVYCHNCGSKLDRSILPQKKETQESPEAAHQRVKKLTNPSRGTVKRTVKSLIYTLVLAVVAAGAIEAARPPDGVPPMPAKRPVDSQPIDMILEEAENAPAPQRLGMTEEIINAYLFNALKGKPNDYLGENLEFDRLFVRLGENDCVINIQETLFGWPIYLGSDYRLSMQNNTLNAINLGGSIGRLPVHPKLMTYGRYAFANVFDALKHQQAVMSRLQGLEIQKGSDKTPGRIVVYTKGGGR